MSVYLQPPGSVWLHRPVFHTCLFIYSHLDPYGCTVQYLDAAFRNIYNNGVMVITATDVAALYGELLVNLQWEWCPPVGLKRFSIWWRCFLPPANEVRGKVIFLHLFVILFTGGACVVAPRGACMVAWGVCMVAPGGCMVAPRGGVHGCSGGMCGCSWGACMVAPGGCMVALGGVCVGYDEIQRYDQWVGSTHPTGMHSCSNYNSRMKWMEF